MELERLYAQRSAVDAAIRELELKQTPRKLDRAWPSSEQQLGVPCKAL